MGLDYRFRLYFKREDRWEALIGVSRFAQHSALPTLILFPDHILSIPMQGWGKDQKLVNHDAPELGFVTALYFPPDEAIHSYLQRVSPEHYEAMCRESPFGLPVGYIYLSIRSSLNYESGKPWDEDLVLFDFSTPGSKMSILFIESDSIRNRFAELLKKYHGVCGVLDMEDSGTVFWLNGKPMDSRIPDPDLSPAEIEAYLNSTDQNAEAKDG